MRIGLEMPFFDPTNEGPLTSATPAVVLARLFEAVSAAGLLVYIGAYLLILPVKRVELVAFQGWPRWGIVTSLLAFLCGAFRHDGKATTDNNSQWVFGVYLGADIHAYRSCERVLT
jgi:hypothetical protein